MSRSPENPLKTNEESINLLLASIKAEISRQLKNAISPAEGAEALQELYERYLLLKKNNEVSARQRDPLKDLLYQHNINNFCRYTGIYQYNGDSLELLNYHGEIEREKAIPVIITAKTNGHTDGYECLEQGMSGRLPVNIHLYRFTIKPRLFMIVSVSSSNYFSQKKFEFLGGIIEQIYTRGENCDKPVHYDFIASYSKKIKKHLTDNSGEGCAADVFIYSFPNIDKIIDMSNIYTYNLTSSLIKNFLEKWFGEYSLVLQIEASRYAVIKPENIDKEENVKNPENIEFIFKEINLPFRFSQFRIEKNNIEYGFWAGSVL